MTNGDLDCLHDGLGREAESVQGLSALGVPEDRVWFLGYPDGALSSLGVTPLPPRKRKIGGECRLGDTTYGTHGFGRADYHTVRFGGPARYTREAAISDLASVLSELDSDEVAITHPEDTHPDHAATYVLFRQALERLGRAPRVHRAIVHNGDCWPTGTTPHEPCPPTIIDPSKPTPPLSGRLTGYRARERLLVPSSCLSPDPSRNAKVRAIGAHASQTRGTLESYLFSFARSDEAFFPETYRRSTAKPGADRRWRVAGESCDDRMVSTELLVRAGERREARTGLPFFVTGSFARPGDAGGLIRLRFLGDASGAYLLELDANRVEARLLRARGASEASEPSLLKTWPLPHDVWRARSLESFAIGVERRPQDDVVEISLSCRGEIVGVAVDVRPEPRGEWIEISGATDQRLVIQTNEAGTCAGEVSGYPSARPAP